MKDEKKVKNGKKIVKVKAKIQERKKIGLASFETANYINPPNSITLLRVMLVGSICTHIVNGEYFWAFINLIIANYTDWLDGYIARKYKQVTEFGAKFDPTADKLLNVLVLIIALNEGSIFTHELLGINNIYSITIIESFLFLTAWIFKPLLTSYGWKKKLGTNYFGKSKMVFESTTIFLAIIYLANWLPYVNQEIKALAEYSLDLTIILGIGSIIGHYYLKNNNTNQSTTT